MHRIVDKRGRPASFLGVTTELVLRNTHAEQWNTLLYVRPLSMSNYPQILCYNIAVHVPPQII